MDKKHLFSLSVTLIIVMLFSAMGPTTVYADGETPPADPPTTETTENDETGEGEAGDTSTEEDAGEEPTEETSEEQDDETAAAEEVAEESDDEQIDETSASEEETEELPAEETAEEVADEDTVEEPSLMEQVPENTEVVVLNAEGEVEPLVTQEAAEAVLESDPIWCPSGQAPTPGANGCTDSYSSFDELLTFLKDNEGDVAYQTAGTIYVEMGVYGGGESSIDFNDYGFIDFEENDLTIQGGWNTSTGTTTDTSSFDVPIIIGSEVNPWGGSLTLNNIIVSGVADDTALTVYSDGNVTIEDSEFTTNKDGVFIKAGKDVTVRNTKVNDNGTNNWEEVNGKGLEIQSLGYVTLEDVEANDNQIFGADIEAVTGVSVENSFFSGNLMYTPDLDFYGYGLTVVSTQGDIALRDVEANENYLWGAWLDGPNVFIRDSKFNANLSDSDVFIDDMGLIVVSTGDVALRDVEANENGVVGANILADGEIAIRDSFFNLNSGVQVIDDADTYFGYGLEATSTTASISLSVVEVNDNYIFGANLNAAGDVTVTGSSFSRNTPPTDQSDWGLNNKPVINNIELDLVPSGGLMIQSGGNVTLSTVTANDNQTFGADILADGFVDIADSVFSNNVNGAGLTANSATDQIRLTNVITLGNGLDGANLETNCDLVTVTGGQFVGNAQYGLYITNSLLALNGSPVFTPPDNSVGPTMVVNPGGCIFPSPLPNIPNNSDEDDAPLYVVTQQPESALPATLDQTFVSALQVTLTTQGKAASNLTITLSFPIPAGMEDANLTVMFWNGSEWVAASGGSVIGNQFVITVTQPGVYVLVAQ